MKMTDRSRRLAVEIDRLTDLVAKRSQELVVDDSSFFATEGEER
jgi:hypothetical protein